MRFKTASASGLIVPSGCCPTANRPERHGRPDVVGLGCWLCPKAIAHVARMAAPPHRVSIRYVAAIEGETIFPVQPRLLRYVTPHSGPRTRPRTRQPDPLLPSQTRLGRPPRPFLSARSAGMVSCSQPARPASSRRPPQPPRTTHVTGAPSLPGAGGTGRVGRRRQSVSRACRSRRPTPID